MCVWVFFLITLKSPQGTVLRSLSQVASPQPGEKGLRPSSGSKSVRATMETCQGLWEPLLYLATLTALPHQVFLNSYYNYYTCIIVWKVNAISKVSLQCQ